MIESLQVVGPHPDLFTRAELHHPPLSVVSGLRERPLLAVVLGGMPKRMHLDLAAGHEPEVDRLSLLHEEAVSGQATGAMALARVHLPSRGVIEPLCDYGVVLEVLGAFRWKAGQGRRGVNNLEKLTEAKVKTLRRVRLARSCARVGGKDVVYLDGLYYSTAEPKEVKTGEVIPGCIAYEFQ